MDQLSYGPFITREQAIEKGCNMFYTGMQCSRGHVDVRYTKSNNCAYCMKKRGYERRNDDTYEEFIERQKVVVDRPVYGPFISRELAMEKGYKQYYTGLPCSYGHVDTRFINKACRECCRIRSDKRYHDESTGRKANNRMHQRRKAKDPVWRTRRNQTQAKTRARFMKEHGYSKSTHYYRTDENYRLAAALRARMYETIVKIQDGKQVLSSFALIGCSIDDLKEHLENQFQSGMTWQNFGEWHIDHIRPCASFDLTDPKQQQECFHYTNLQPLWAAENISKNDKWDGAIQTKSKMTA